MTGDGWARGAAAATAVGTFLAWRTTQEHSILGNHDRLLAEILVWWLAWAVSIACLRRSSARQVLLVVVLGAVALRLAAITAVVPLSDDLYRYAWDGRVQASGTDPYRYPPTAPELAELRATTGCSRTTGSARAVTSSPAARSSTGRRSARSTRPWHRPGSWPGTPSAPPTWRTSAGSCSVCSRTSRRWSCCGGCCCAPGATRAGWPSTRGARSRCSRRCRTATSTGSPRSSWSRPWGWPGGGRPGPAQPSVQPRW